MNTISDDGFDLLGALSDHYIVARVNKIDGVKLRNKLGAVDGAYVPLALTVQELMPAPVLRAALASTAPLVSRVLWDDFGIDADIKISDVAPPAGSPPQYRDLLPGAAIGVGVTLAGMFLFRRLFGGA